MSNPFELGNAVETEKIVLPEKAQIIFNALRDAEPEGVDSKQLLEILCQHGLVDVEDGFDEVPYKISEWDETPYYDIDYKPRYKQLSVYDSDDLNDATSLLQAKGLIRLDRKLKKWFVSTPDRSWEKSLHELQEVKLLKIPVETAKEQIRCYQKEAPEAEVFAIGALDAYIRFGSDKYKTCHQKLTLAGGQNVDLSVFFEGGTKKSKEQLIIELVSKETVKRVLLAIEGPEGALRALMKVEIGKKIHLPTSELDFDPTETGLVFRVLEASS